MAPFVFRVLRLDRGVMHEAVLVAGLGRDEAEALRFVEPLHDTGDTCHLVLLLTKSVRGGERTSPCDAPLPYPSAAAERRGSRRSASASCPGTARPWCSGGGTSSARTPDGRCRPPSLPLP